MDNLVARIYHEKQQEGSMLCAQHALNALLQGNYFTAPDLSEIAKELDTLEQSYDDDNHGTRSGNMDDTGFFSVQVLEKALEVWGLLLSQLNILRPAAHNSNNSLSRWRSEEMRPFQDHPESQLAFILNYEHHWYCLRRFGNKYWFNLNSLSPRPEWISPLYLGMAYPTIAGYSVFVVRPIDPDNAAPLPHTAVDDIALTVPEPGSAPQVAGSEAIDGMEDEDYELQAALHASLMGEIEVDAPPPVIRPPVPLPVTVEDDEMDEDADPVAASMARNKRALEEMRREQEYARRQMLFAETGQDDTEDEMLRQALRESGSDNNAPAEHPASHLAHAGRDRVYDDDDADLQAALKASLEEAPAGWSFAETPEPSRQQPIFESAPPAALSAMTRSASSSSVDIEESEEQIPAVEEVSVEEMRRRRLAKFGG
ncbi:Josephin domain-containing protein [Mycena chlorophos]|uniref:ubiquitinyl hydrolase 1 n=1 Tax=Mycena chlorophos TaxID=658473 RepID=A0A8H6VSQ6_MYCCL|nr:Josephin domain-containing protein [Mycena chlorophos]